MFIPLEIRDIHLNTIIGDNQLTSETGNTISKAL